MLIARFIAIARSRRLFESIKIFCVSSNFNLHYLRLGAKFVPFGVIALSDNNSGSMLEKTNNRSFLKTIALVAMLICLAPYLSSCLSAENNDKDIGQLITHFTENGLKITEIGTLQAEPAQADSAVTLKIAGREIGIYKYDMRRKKQKERLEKAVARGFIGIAGHKFSEDDFVVNGSFMMIDFKANPEKDGILKTFKSF